MLERWNTEPDLDQEPIFYLSHFGVAFPASRNLPFFYVGGSRFGIPAPGKNVIRRQIVEGPEAVNTLPFVEPLGH
jgi:hypothetical protein